MWKILLFIKKIYTAEYANLDPQENDSMENATV